MPHVVEGYQALTRADESKELIRNEATRLRALLEQRDDADAVSAYRTLWTLEFQATPTSEYDALRERAARDVQRIRALNLQEKHQWYDTLEEGYKLTKDEKNAAWVRDEREKHDPSPWRPPSVHKWMEDHHYPSEDAPEETQHNYHQQLLAQTDRWIEERPNATFIWGWRLDALSHLNGTLPKEIENAADQVLQVASRNAGPAGPDSGTYFRVCEALAKRHLQPDKVLQMAQKGIEAVRAENKFQFDDLYTDEKRAAQERFYDTHQEVDALAYMAGAYLELTQPDEAQISLSRMDEKLRDLKARVGDVTYRKETHLEQLSVYWGHMARLTELRRRKIDAMGFYDAIVDFSSVRCYRKRWRVERLFAWLHHFRRLVRRWEHHIENFFDMARLGCMKILLRYF